jgi:hypothetical protein
MTVVDASAIVDLLAPPALARRDFLLRQLPEASEPWLAPDILPFEGLLGVLDRRLQSSHAQRHASWLL